MTARQVTIDLTPDDAASIAESIGTRDQLMAAIGYLSMWNLTYPQVAIFRDGGDDLIAVYKDAQGRRQYTIGAVWHGDHYGYHS